MNFNLGHEPMKTYLMLGAACLTMAAAPAFAQTVEEQHTVVVQKDHGGAAPGMVGGAVAGAMVAGPVGAVVGAVAGATIGHSIAPPSEVRTYVTTQSVATVRYEDKIVVGKRLNGDIVWYEVPSHPTYRWAYLNGQRVVIDNESRNVVAVY
jgi:hypothetical protein